MFQVINLSEAFSFHNSNYFNCASISDNVEHIYKQLQHCEEGIQAVLQMEKNHYDDKIISLLESGQVSDLTTTENKSIIQLEATILDVGSTYDLCQGIL